MTGDRGQPDRVSISIGAYNINNGRAGRLEGALRALRQMNLDVGFLTETKLTDGIHTRWSSDYHVYATAARSRHQGGIALVYRNSDYWQIESVRKHGPNVISCELVTGPRRVPLVGVYIPPNDLTTLEYLAQALELFPKGKPIVLGDLNANLNSPRDARDAEVASLLSSNGLEDMLQHFKSRQGFRHGKTWRMVREGVQVTSRCDYLLGSDRRMFMNVQHKDPRCFNSDHLMVWAKMLSAPKWSNRRYLQGRMRFPLRLNKVGPQTRADTWLQELKKEKTPLTRETRARTSWISNTTWQLIDERASLRRQQPHNQKDARTLTRRIRAAVKADRKSRVEAAGAAIEAQLAANNARGAWNRLQAWYRHAGDRPSKPSRKDVEIVTTEFSDLYRRVPPSGDPIPILVGTFNVPDNVPPETEIAKAVKRLKTNKSPGPTGLRNEDFKTWLAAAQRAERPDRQNWETLVSIVQHAFRTGEIPTELAWSTLVLLPKGSGGHRGIGLLETLWKLISCIIDARIKSAVVFHDSLHGFRANRGTGTAIIEAKLIQQLAALEQVPLYEVFLDLQKAYDTLDRERTLEILVGYGVGPAAIRLLHNFWDQQQVVARLGGYYGMPFEANRGVTQGDIISPTIFNVVVDAVVRYWLQIVSENNLDAMEGMGSRVRTLLSMFYADDGIIATRSDQYLQQTLDCLVEIFLRIGLKTNTDKTKVMTCFPGHISGRISSPSYRHRMRGEGDSHRERQRRRVLCPECNCVLSAGSLQQHMRTQHGLAGVIRQEDALPDLLPTYTVSFPRTATSIDCPVDGCVGKATSRNDLRRHFVHRHVQSTLVILEEGSAPLPRCELCDMFVTFAALNSGHQNTACCRKGRARKEQRHAREDARRASEAVFTVHGIPLDSVQDFTYLGRTLNCFDCDWPAVHRNLQKARKRWAMVSRVLAREGANPRISGMFYKAVVQSVLLYGSESWNLSSSMLKLLEGFHHQVARRLSGRRARYLQREDRWFYPPIAEALEICGLHPIQEYLRRRRQTIEDYVACRPIYTLCTSAERMSGASRRQWWWDQPAR